MANVVGAQHGVRASKPQRRNMLYTRRAKFLAHFAVNCNVQAAAEAAGVALSTIFRWRRADPDFAALWAEALAQGYQMLEARLLSHALGGGGAGEHEVLDGAEGTPLAPLNVEQAIRIMGLHRHGATKGFPGAPRKPVSVEEIEKRLATKLDAIARRQQAEKARIAELSGEAGAMPEPDVADRTERESA